MITEEMRVKICGRNDKKSYPAKNSFVITYRGKVWLLMILVCVIFWGEVIFFVRG